jgi:hypothetical protein
MMGGRFWRGHEGLSEGSTHLLRPVRREGKAEKKQNNF